jgi:hypothetical protein
MVGVEQQAEVWQYLILGAFFGVLGGLIEFIQLDG